MASNGFVGRLMGIVIHKPRHSYFVIHKLEATHDRRIFQRIDKW
jgi:hypothetical protein